MSLSYGLPPFFSLERAAAPYFGIKVHFTYHWKIGIFLILGFLGFFLIILIHGVMDNSTPGQLVYP